MKDILLITPPFVQPNCPYPATAYLKGWLERQGVQAGQGDLSVELLNRVFSGAFLGKMFSKELPASQCTDENINRIHALRNSYIRTADTVIKFLQGRDSTLANLIIMPDFLPQASRFEGAADLMDQFGQMGTQDCAKYLCTLYLQDLSDYIRTVVTPHFEIVRYAGKISVSVPSFDILEHELAKPANIIEQEMFILLEEQIKENRPKFIGFTIPFPGNLLAALRCAQYIRQNYPDTIIIAGGGYPTTELRSMTDSGIYKYFDRIILDDGEAELLQIVRGKKVEPAIISHAERGCPDFTGLPHPAYFSLLEVLNPMHRLWSDGRWNKMTIAHGCYWAKCAFCDTSLDYIRKHGTVPAGQFVDWMEQVAGQTGSTGFHFTDEAAPPKLLRDISLELIRRGLRYTWWTNIRFEKSFTADLCRLMSEAGCIAVSGGLETASDRLLELMGKGITIESASMAMRNFYRSGIMVHAYLMYGFPTQTLQETVDSLEIVRQMFRAGLIDSAFWHRYAMTVHSPSGSEPGKFGITGTDNTVNPFANNEIYFEEKRNYDIGVAGDALNLSLANYLNGSGLEKGVHKWFEGGAPRTTIEPSEITDHMIKPDLSRLFNPDARVVWLGAKPERTDEGLRLWGNSRGKTVRFPDEVAEFIMNVIAVCSDLGRKTTLQDVSGMYSGISEEPFVVLYHSKKWDVLREYGLLQI